MYIYIYNYIYIYIEMFQLSSGPPPPPCRRGGRPTPLWVLGSLVGFGPCTRAHTLQHAVARCCRSTIGRTAGAHFC